MDDPWHLVHAERVALVDDLTRLDADSFDQPSLCEGWSVHDVVAHLVDNALTTRLGFLVGLTTHRLDFDRLNASGVRRHRGATPADTLGRLREVASRRSGPPAPFDSRLVEEVVHGEDVRVPLGLNRSYPPEVLERCLQVQARLPESLGGAQGLLRSVRVVATDEELAVGDGVEVRGDAVRLLQAVSGRRSAIAALDGPGVAALRASLDER